MKILVINRKITLSILMMTVLVSVSFFIIGCGEVDDETEDGLVVNNQPSIETISDQTVDVGNTVEVKIIITDADVGDTHTISAASDDTAASGALYLSGWSYF